jgi:glycosyltransferase involved in cell wall biosynthesis
VKGMHHLISAFVRAENLGNTKKLKLVITGTGYNEEEYISHLHDLAKESKNIVFTGALNGEELAQIYKNAFLYVNSAEVEGLSNALLEAMGYGVPVLASDIEENVRPLSKSGIFFQNKNTKDLTKKIAYCIANKERMNQKGNLAKKRVEKNYSWDTNTHQTLQVYESVLQQIYS